MSWENMVAGPQDVLTKHHRVCEACSAGFWRSCGGRAAVLAMQDAKVLAWQEGSFMRQGWEIHFR